MNIVSHEFILLGRWGSFCGYEEMIEILEKKLGIVKKNLGITL